MSGAAVAKIGAERGPEDGDKRLGPGGKWVGNGMPDAAAGILGDIPVLDPNVLAVASWAVVRVGGDIANGVDVLEPFNQKKLVCAERAVFFEGDEGVGFEEFGGRGDADAENDKVCGEGGSVFESHGTDS